MDITQLGGPNRVRITLIEPLDVLRLGIESLLKSNYNYTVECYKSYKDFKKYSREIESFLLNVYLVHSIPFSVKKNEVLKYLDVFVPSHKTIFIIDDSTSIDCFEQNLDSIFDVIKLNQPTNDFVNCISTAMSTNKKSTLELKQKFMFDKLDILLILNKSGL